MNYKKVYPTEVLQGFTDTAMFVLMLYDPMGDRKVPVMIGEHEAEMIILEQERQQAKRPMTYQLILSILDAFALTLKLVRIDRFEEGIFYATLIVSDGFNDKEIDARASDAVVLALHQSVDIEMAEQVLEETGFTPKDNDIELGTHLSGEKSIEELEPRMFSFNNPMGACPECKGLGFIQRVDPDILIPEQDKSIEERCLKNVFSTMEFTQSTAIGHKGNLIFGKLDGVPVLAMQGRFHYYEGYTMQEVTLPVRVMARLGVKRLLVSNAAGGMNPDFNVGDLMIITDHISFMPNPLIGKNIDEMGVRFPDMTTVYSTALRQRAKATASAMGITLREGVYVAETGPSYETPAEYRMYRMLGGDAVGMSTVPEVIVARHSGMEIFGMSVITNCAKDLSESCQNDGDDVVRAADRAADTMTKIFASLI